MIEWLVQAVSTLIAIAVVTAFILMATVLYAFIVLVTLVFHLVDFFLKRGYRQ